MTVLILNRFPLDLVDYAAWLDDDAVMITSRAALPSSGLRLDSYLEVVTVADYGSAATDALAKRLIEQYRCDALVALSEFDLLRAARIRDCHGLKGPTVTEVLPYRDKLRMKELALAGGIRVAHFSPVDHTSELLEFWEETDGPIVVKPRLGASSIGVEVISSELELMEYCRASSKLSDDEPAHLLTEEYVDNQMFNVDGIVIDGRVRICWPSSTTSCLGFGSGEFLVAAQLDLDDEHTASLREIICSTIEAMPTSRHCIFHAEVFLSPDGTYRLNEIGARIGGAKVRELVTRGFGVDPVEWYVREMFGAGMPSADPPESPFNLHAYCLLPPTQGTVLSIDPALLSSRPGLDSIELRVREGDTLKSARSSIDGIALLVTHGSTTEEAERRAVEYGNVAKAGIVIER